MDKFNRQIRDMFGAHLKVHQQEVKERRWNDGIPFIVKSTSACHDYPDMSAKQAYQHLDFLYQTLMYDGGPDKAIVDRFFEDQYRFLRHMHAGVTNLKYLIPRAELKKDQAAVDLYKSNLKKKNTLIKAFSRWLKENHKKHKRIHKTADEEAGA